MAWVRSNKKGSGGGSIPKLTLHSGKINLSNGNIESDSDYYYTDEFPCPNGYMYFDLGEISSSSYIGMGMYTEQGLIVDYWSASGRFRNVNCSSYYQNRNVRKLRLSFHVDKLQYVTVVDVVNWVTYANNIYYVDV